MTPRKTRMLSYAFLLAIPAQAAVAGAEEVLLAAAYQQTEQAVVAAKKTPQTPKPPAKPAPSGTVPAPLADIEGLAEGAYDAALAGDNAKVAAAAAAMDAKWKAFRPEAAKAGAAKKTLAALDSAIAGLGSASGGPSATARSANKVSAVMDELYSLYNPPVPPAIMKLDYLGREVVLDGTEKDFAKAAAHVKATDQAWSALKPQIVAKSGAKEAAAYDQSVASLKQALQAKDAAALAATAKAGLETVDAMEKLFGH